MGKRILAWILIVLFIFLNINLFIGYYKGLSALVYIGVVAAFLLLKFRSKGDSNE